MNTMVALEEIGRKLWGVDFMVGYIADTGITLDENASYDDWSDAIYENAETLRQMVGDLKMALMMLPPDMAGGIAAGFRQEDDDSKARGAASCFLASVQRKASPSGNAP